jgi:hypothetical protein
VADRCGTAVVRCDQGEPLAGSAGECLRTDFHGFNCLQFDPSRRISSSYLSGDSTEGIPSGVTRQWSSYHPGTGDSLLGKLIYGLSHHEPLGLLKPISWFAPDGVDPKETGYYAAQANASKVFLGNQFKGELGSWDIPILESLPAIALRGIGRIQQAAVLSLFTFSRHSGFRKDSRSLAQYFCDSPVGGPREEVHTLKAGPPFGRRGTAAAENINFM